MSRKTRTILAAAAACLFAAGLAALRACHLAIADENGLLPVGSGIYIGYLVLTVLFIAALAALCTGLRRDTGTEACFRGNLPLEIVSAVCLLAATAGFMMQAFAADSRGEGILCACCALAMLLLVVCEALRLMEGKASFLFGLFAALALAARLVVRFKVWSYDPVITDFCFLLLASVFAMLSVFNTAGFPLNYGKRRATVFLSLTGFAFSAAAVPDLVRGFEGFSAADALVYLGLGVYCGLIALRLLLDGLKDAPAPEAGELPEQPAAPAAEQDPDFPFIPKGKP